VPKFRRATPPNSEVISANLVHFKPIFDPSLKEVVRRAAIPGGGCASKTWSFSSARKNLGAQHPLGPRGRNIFFRKMRFTWVRVHIEISKVTGPKFTGLVSPNVGGIALDKVKIRF